VNEDESINYHAMTSQRDAVALELADAKLAVALARIIQLEQDQKCCANEEIALLKKQVAADEEYGIIQAAKIKELEKQVEALNGFIGRLKR
jgi:hypothetical protein